MKGTPNNAVACVRCTKVRAARPGELCQICKMGDARAQFKWAPAHDRKVVDLYQEARTLRALSTGTTRLARELNVSRRAVGCRAQMLGLARQAGRPWTAAEIRYVEESAGSMRPARIAQALGRSYPSVVHRIQRLGRAGRLTKGYTREDLAACLGVCFRTVENWITRGWLRLNPDDRISDVIVERFLAQHPEAYDLRRVDQFWFKSAMFPQAPCYRASVALEEVGRGREEREERSA